MARGSTIVGTMPLDPALTDYLNHITHGRRLSPTTVQSRKHRLGCLVRYLDLVPLLEATPDQLEAYVATELAHLATGSLYVALSCLSCFYDWATLTERIAVDPTLRLARPKLPRRLPRPMPEDALAHALAHAKQPIRVMLVLAAYMGLRCCEIAAATREDVLDTNIPPLLLVHGKGDNDRLLPIPAPVLAELRAYGLRRGPLVRRPDGRPGHITANRASQLICKHLHGLGLELTAHQARHRMATVAYRATRDLRAVQAALGHASPLTTSIYAAFADEALEDVMTAAAAGARPLRGVAGGQPAVGGPADPSSWA